MVENTENANKHLFIHLITGVSGQQNYSSKPYGVENINT